MPKRTLLTVALLPLALLALPAAASATALPTDDTAVEAVTHQMPGADADHQFVVGVWGASGALGVAGMLVYGVLVSRVGAREQRATSEELAATDARLA